MSGFPELVYEDRKEDRLGLGPNAMSIDLLRAVYRNHRSHYQSGSDVLWRHYLMKFRDCRSVLRSMSSHLLRRLVYDVLMQ